MKHVEPTQTPPNLFSYAPDEKTQDGFISWMLAWAVATDDQSKNDPGLRKYGLVLLNSFFEKAGKTAPKEIKSFEINRQHKIDVGKKKRGSIDILCVIKGETEIYPIIIEDKVATKDHHNQLSNYLTAIKKDYQECINNILPIYFKTYDESDYSGVESKNYTPFLRADILAVLAEYNGKDSILCNYRNYLQEIENEVQSYRTKNIADWNGRQWTGFYIEVKNRLKTGNWNGVKPPGQRVFMAFYWGWQGESGVLRQYLQLQENKLCFKIEVTGKNVRSSIRNKWHSMVMEKAKEFDLKLSKPKKFGTGETMTVCMLVDDYRVADDRGVIDMDRTIERLKQAEELLKSLKASH